MISVISPIFNEVETIAELYERVKNTLIESNETEFELILVDNGSTDDSLNLMKELRLLDRRVKIVSLSKNFGHQGGILAGLVNAKGDAVISIDGDLQQPPELIKEMLALWRSGYEVVYTIKKEINRPRRILNVARKIFYRLLSRISNLNLAYGQSDYRLLDRRAIDALLSMPETNKFIRGLVEWIGFAQIAVEYTPVRRRYGNSKFSLYSYINFALDGIFSFSLAPLRMVLVFGAIVAVCCIFYSFYLMLLGILLLMEFNVSNPPGWATITVSITFLGGVQLIAIGLVGEYTARAYAEAKKRPEFVIRYIDID